MIQAGKSLNLNLFEKPSADEPMATCSPDVESKIGKSEYSLIQNSPAPAIAQSCVKCKYKQDGVPILFCSECNDAWHIQCLEFSDYQQKIGSVEKNWRCPSCIRCTNCKSMVGNK